jgi:hypothetical protein
MVTQELEKLRDQEAKSSPLSRKSSKLQSKGFPICYISSLFMPASGV